MSSTDFAYTVIGARIPAHRLFGAVDHHLACRTHGMMAGKHCSECGGRLEESWKLSPTGDMKKAAEHYGLEAVALWDMMRDKHEQENNPAPLAWWKTDYGSPYGPVNPDNEVVIGIHLVATPYKGHEKYPIAVTSIGSLLETSRTVEEHLKHFGITDKPQLFVFAYA